MKLQLTTILIASLMTTGAIAWGTSATARPYPDQVGVCYAFESDTQARLEPCIISAGYGAGAHYATLNWMDGTKTSIMMVNDCPDGNYDLSGFCGYTVNDRDAEVYQRDVFLGETTFDDPDNLLCYRVVPTAVQPDTRLGRSTIFRPKEWGLGLLNWALSPLSRRSTSQAATDSNFCYRLNES